MARNSLSVLIGKLRRRRRKYPIKRDESGKTARRRAFELFDNGKRPAEVAYLVGITKRTGFRYFQDWKKLGPNFEARYTIVKKVLDSSPKHHEGAVKMICELLGLPEEEVRARFQEPWGLKRFMMDRWSTKETDTNSTEQSKEWARFKEALDLIYLTEILKVPIGTIKAEIKRMLDNAESGGSKNIKQA